MPQYKVMAASTWEAQDYFDIYKKIIEHEYWKTFVMTPLKMANELAKTSSDNNNYEKSLQYSPSFQKERKI